MSEADPSTLVDPLSAAAPSLLASTPPVALRPLLLSKSVLSLPFLIRETRKDLSSQSGAKDELFLHFDSFLAYLLLDPSVTFSSTVPLSHLQIFYLAERFLCRLNERNLKFRFFVFQNSGNVNEKEDVTLMWSHSPSVLLLRRCLLVHLGQHIHCRIDMIFGFFGKRGWERYVRFESPSVVFVGDILLGRQIAAKLGLGGGLREEDDDESSEDPVFLRPFFSFFLQCVFFDEKKAHTRRILNSEDTAMAVEGESQVEEGSRPPPPAAAAVTESAFSQQPQQQQAGQVGEVSTGVDDMLDVVGWQGLEFCSNGLLGFVWKRRNGSTELSDGPPWLCESVGVVEGGDELELESENVSAEESFVIGSRRKVVSEACEKLVKRLDVDVSDDDVGEKPKKMKALLQLIQKAVSLQENLTLDQRCLFLPWLDLDVVVDTDTDTDSPSLSLDLLSERKFVVDGLNQLCAQILDILPPRRIGGGKVEAEWKLSSTSSLSDPPVWIVDVFDGRLVMLCWILLRTGHLTGTEIVGLSADTDADADTSVVALLDQFGCESKMLLARGNGPKKRKGSRKGSREEEEGEVGSDSDLDSGDDGMDDWEEDAELEEKVLAELTGFKMKSIGRKFLYPLRHKLLEVLVPEFCSGDFDIEFSRVMEELKAATSHAATATSPSASASSDITDLDIAAWLADDSPVTPSTPVDAPVVVPDEIPELENPELALTDAEIEDLSALGKEVKQFELTHHWSVEHDLTEFEGQQGNRGSRWHYDRQIETLRRYANALNENPKLVEAKAPPEPEPERRGGRPQKGGRRRRGRGGRRGKQQHRNQQPTMSKKQIRVELIAEEQKWTRDRRELDDIVVEITDQSIDVPRLNKVIGRLTTLYVSADRPVEGLLVYALLKRARKAHDVLEGLIVERTDRTPYGNELRWRLFHTGVVIRDLLAKRAMFDAVRDEKRKQRQSQFQQSQSGGGGRKGRGKKGRRGRAGGGQAPTPADEKAFLKTVREYDQRWTNAAVEPIIARNLAVAGVTDETAVRFQLTNREFFQSIEEVREHVRFTDYWNREDFLKFKGPFGFIPDPWQKQLMGFIDRRRSVVVSAPTSSGKTFLAFYLMQRVLEESDDGVIVYVSPTVPLVNQMAAEIMSRYKKTYRGDKKLVGLFTSQDRIKPLDCQVLVTVAHCFVHLLLSADDETQAWRSRIKYVVFDEIHKINDFGDSGSVWEQLLLMTRSPFLALSATIGNPNAFVEWLNLERNEDEEVELIIYGERPCDLNFYVFDPREMQAGSKSALRVIHPFALLNENAVLNLLETEISNTKQLTPNQLQELYGLLREVHPESVVDLAPEEFFSDYVRSFIPKPKIRQYEAMLKERVAKLARVDRPKLVLLVERLRGDLYNHFVEYDEVPQKRQRQAGEEEEGEVSDEPRAEPEAEPEAEAEAAVSEPEKSEPEPEPVVADVAEPEKDVRRVRFAPSVVGGEDDERERSGESDSNSDSDRDEDDEDEDEMEEETFSLMDQIFNLCMTMKSERCFPSICFHLVRVQIERLALQLVADLDEFDEMLYDSERERERLCEFIDESIAHLRKIDRRGDNQLLRCLRYGIAVHHGGISKHYRAEVERLFREKKLKLMIATGTLAHGVNMPCKTVVLFGDSIFLNATLFNQTSGRSGRRGFDTSGKVILYGIPACRCRRFMVSDNEKIQGKMGITASFILRCMLLLEKNGRFLEDVLRLLSTPLTSITRDPMVARQQVLHQLRLSVEFLLRQGYLHLDGSPVHFASLAAHLSMEEPESFLFLQFVKTGLLHRLYAVVKEKNAGKSKEFVRDQFSKAMFKLLCYFFAGQGRERSMLYAGSDLVLPPLLKLLGSEGIYGSDAQMMVDLVSDYESFCTHTVQAYIRHLGLLWSQQDPDAKRGIVGNVRQAPSLPLSEFLCGVEASSGSDSDSPLFEKLKSFQNDLRICSVFAGLSGHHDEGFPDVRTILACLRKDVDWDSTVLPFPKSVLRSYCVSSYLWDFYINPSPSLRPITRKHDFPSQEVDSDILGFLRVLRKLDFSLTLLAPLSKGASADGTVASGVLKPKDEVIRAIRQIREEFSAKYYQGGSRRRVRKKREGYLRMSGYSTDMGDISGLGGAGGKAIDSFFTKQKGGDSMWGEKNPERSFDASRQQTKEKRGGAGQREDAD